MTSDKNQESRAANDPAPSEKAASAEDIDPGSKTAEPDPLAQLKTDLEATKAESEQWRDRCLRKAAEFENFRKRSDRERRESACLVKSSVLMEFLPVMDACERALNSFKEGEDRAGRLQSYREGVELLYKQLGDTLNRLGVVPLMAKGQTFDPHKHEALARLETAEYEDNTVIEELRRGYLLRDRLLRPAQVVVATSPKPKHENPS
jgi:molecular chaperone GrpE